MRVTHMVCHAQTSRHCQRCRAGTNQFSLQGCAEESLVCPSLLGAIWPQRHHIQGGHWSCGSTRLSQPRCGATELGGSGLPHGPWIAERNVSRQWNRVHEIKPSYASGM